MDRRRSVHTLNMVATPKDCPQSATVRKEQGLSSNASPDRHTASGYMTSQFAANHLKKPSTTMKPPKQGKFLAVQQQQALSISQPQPSMNSTLASDARGKGIPQAPPMTMKPKTKTKMGVSTYTTHQKPKTFDVKRQGGSSAVRKHSQQHIRQSSYGA